MRFRAPRAIADLLPNAVPNLGDRLLEHRIRRAWPTLLGADAARRTQPQAFANGCLSVCVDNSPWLHEVTLRAEELTRRVQERFPEIRALRFMLGAVEPVNAPPAAWSPKVSAVPLDDSARSAIDEATSVIHDPTLAAAARRLLTKAWRSSR